MTSPSTEPLIIPEHGVRVTHCGGKATFLLDIAHVVATIDRVINGMERKAAKGLWKGGRRPFGYQVDRNTWTLTEDPTEAPIVRLIFRLYTHDRLGSKLIARILNDRGHRTATAGRWSAHQTLRVLANRTYLGELSFREITVTRCHHH